MRSVKRIKQAMTAAFVVALLATSLRADDRLEYAEEDGTIKIAPVAKVLKSTDRELIVKARVLGRSTRLKLPVRRVIEFRLGNSEAVSQWSRQLAKAKRLMAVGKLATEGTMDGAEALLQKIGASTEKGIPGEEKAYSTRPEHNMYAILYLIETQLMMGRAGVATKFDAALDSVKQFRARSTAKYKKKMTMTVGGQTKSVYGWGPNWLGPYVDLLEARIQAAKGGRTKALELYSQLDASLKKNNGSPRLLTYAVMERAAVETKGTDITAQERVYRNAGVLMARYARTQRDQFGKNELQTAANRALIRGADLLLENAHKTKSYQNALKRYQTLKAGEGQKDRAVLIGARTGIGICLTEMNQGEQAYHELLAVVVNGGGQPEHASKALYYLGRAAVRFAEEIDGGGGDGAFLRTESKRWWHDLIERYPGSGWAKKVKDK